MKKKIIGCVFGVMVLGLCSSAVAQPAKKIPRIGYLTSGARLGSETREEAFRQGLRELGYTDGKNIVIEYRFADANLGKTPALAAELVNLKVDLIVAITTGGALAARDATQTIPIVMRIAGDPVEDGLVANLARPGGNVTGVTSLIQELGGKRLELLKEAIPRLSRVAVLRNPESRASLKWLKEWETAGRALGLQVQSLEVRSPTDIDEAFRVSTKERAGAMTALRNPFIITQRKRIVDLAIKNRLPTVFDDNDFVEAGGLMFYGANLVALQRRLAYFVDKILKGAKPADLPVEQPTKFELVINLRTAKQIGLTIPPNVLARADKVIK
jgi:putative ABC transport system substrate-binding protein